MHQLDYSDTTVRLRQCEIVLAIPSIRVWTTSIHFLKQNRNNQFCCSDDVFSFTTNPHGVT